MLLGTLDGEPSRTSNVQIQLQGVAFINNSSPWYVPPPYSSACILSYKTLKTSLLAQTPPRLGPVHSSVTRCCWHLHPTRGTGKQAACTW